MVNIVAYSIKSDANFGRAGGEFVLHVSRFTVACCLFFFGSVHAHHNLLHGIFKQMWAAVVVLTLGSNSSGYQSTIFCSIDMLYS